MTLAERLEAQRRKEQPAKPAPASAWLRRAAEGKGTVRVDYGRRAA